MVHEYKQTSKEATKKNIEKITTEMYFTKGVCTIFMCGEMV